jgi:hypothetical protein
MNLQLNLNPVSLTLFVNCRLPPKVVYGEPSTISVFIRTRTYSERGS